MWGNDDEGSIRKCRGILEKNRVRWLWFEIELPGVAVGIVVVLLHCWDAENVQKAWGCRTGQGFGFRLQGTTNRRG